MVTKLRNAPNTAVRAIGGFGGGSPLLTRQQDRIPAGALEFIKKYEEVTGTLPPGVADAGASPEEFVRTLTPEQQSQFSTVIYNTLYDDNNQLRNPADATRVMENIQAGRDINYMPEVTLPGVDPKKDDTPDTPDTPVATNWQDEFTKAVTPYADTSLTYKDFALAQKGYEIAGFTPEEAGKFALEDMGRYAKIEVTDKANEKAVSDKVAGLPAEIEQQYTKLNDALAAFSNKNLTEKVNPAIMQSLNARGILDSGALNTALAGAATDAEESRLATIAPLVSEATVGGLKEQYADLLRKAQKSGVELSNPGAFMNTFYTPAYNTAQQGVENAFTANQNSLNRALQTALNNKQIAANASTNEANRKWQESLFNRENEAASQRNQGGLAGQLLAILGGAGMGALSTPATPWVGAARGGLMGLTGKYQSY